jgi:hypothetical protein
MLFALVFWLQLTYKAYNTLLVLIEQVSPVIPECPVLEGSIGKESLVDWENKYSRIYDTPPRRLPNVRTSPKSDRGAYMIRG